jgi:hypothetical protein
VAEETGLVATATVTGTPKPLSPDAEVTLLRVTQEALANVTRHAQAGRWLSPFPTWTARPPWTCATTAGGSPPAADGPGPGHHHRRLGAQSVIRLLVADDHPVVRDGLRGMLASEADLEVVGEAASGGEAVLLTERERPDVVLMDLQMPEMDGATATAEIAALERGSIALPRRSP